MTLLRNRQSTGGGGWVCPMCGLNVRHAEAGALVALWHLHLKAHDEDLIDNLEHMLRRF
jgi:hypothetical protein